MEYLDLLDADGNKTGVKKLKDQVHREGLLHKCVHVWIVNGKGEILLQKRAGKLSFPFHWDASAAGHISAGSEPITTAVKETLEELGLEVSEKEFEFLFTVKQLHKSGANFIENEIVDVYLVEKDLNLSSLKLQKSEVDCVKWIHFKELQKQISEGKEKIVPHPEEYERLFKILGDRFG